MGNFLLKHSVLAQSFYGMYLTLQEARHNSFRLRRYANIGYLFANILIGILCSYILYKNFDLYQIISNEILVQTEVNFRYDENFLVEFCLVRMNRI